MFTHPKHASHDAGWHVVRHQVAGRAAREVEPLVTDQVYLHGSAEHTLQARQHTGNGFARTTATSGNGSTVVATSSFECDVANVVCFTCPLRLAMVITFKAIRLLAEHPAT